jgi:hypothetical protein
MAIDDRLIRWHRTEARHRVPIACDISYIPAHCRLTGTVRMCARLVRGSDPGENFELLPQPEGEFHSAGSKRHKRAYRR